MSIKEYPKHQFSVELASPTYMLIFTPSYSGYLKHIRLKMLKRNAPTVDVNAYLDIVSGNVDIVSSSAVNFMDIGNASDASDYYHSWVRFDFAETLLAAGKSYKLRIRQSSYPLDMNYFVGYCLDYNFPVNQTSRTNSPFSNTRVAAEIYLLRDYYEFE